MAPYPVSHTAVYTYWYCDPAPPLRASSHLRSVGGWTCYLTVREQQLLQREVCADGDMPAKVGQNKASLIKWCNLLLMSVIAEDTDRYSPVPLRSPELAETHRLRRFGHGARQHAVAAKVTETIRRPMRAAYEQPGSSQPEKVLKGKTGRYDHVTQHIRR